METKTVKLECPSCGENGGIELIQTGNDGCYGGSRFFVCAECDYQEDYLSYVHGDLLEACKLALDSFRNIYETTFDDDVLENADCFPLAKLRKAITKAEME